MDSFQKYFAHKLYVLGGKTRYLAFQKVNSTHPDHFPSLIEKYGRSFTTIQCNVYIHDRNDPVGTLPRDLVIKVAASSNLENPGSGPLTLTQKMSICRKMLFYHLNLPIPPEPNRVELPNIPSGSKLLAWRKASWNVIMGSKLAYEQHRATIETLLQMAKRPKRVLIKLFDFEKLLHDKVQLIPGSRYTRHDFFSSYHIGREGLNNLSDDLVVAVIERCERILNCPNYTWHSIAAICRVVGNDCGIVHFSKLFKCKIELERYLTGTFGFNNIKDLQLAYPGRFTDDKLERLCTVPNSGKRYEPDDNNCSKAPKLPTVLVKYTGRYLPYVWQFYATDVKRMDMNRTMPNYQGVDKRFSFYGDDDKMDGEDDFSSVIFCSEQLSMLDRAAIKERISGHDISWTGFDCIYVEVTQDDSIRDFDRISMIINLTISLRQPTHFNFVFTGAHEDLSALKTWLEDTKKPTITVVRPISHLCLIDPTKERQVAGTSTADPFEAASPVVPYLIAHYSPTTELTPQNFTIGKDKSVFVIKPTLYQCLKRVFTWVTPEEGWVISFALNPDVAMACTARDRNLMICCPTATADDIESFCRTYGQYRTEFINGVSNRTEVDVAESSDANQLDTSNERDDESVFQRPPVPPPRTPNARGRPTPRGFAFGNSPRVAFSNSPRSSFINNPRQRGTPNRRRQKSFNL